MLELSEKHKRFLNILETDEVSRRYSFQKLKGIKWFDRLVERGFLNPEKNPSPIKSDDNLYTVPTWNVLNYLLNTLQQEDEIPIEYKQKYLIFIEEVTKKTKPENSNYRTWWMFAQMLPYLADHLTPKFIQENIPFWLDDRFTTSITIKELTENLFPKLLEIRKKDVALELLKAVITVEKIEKRAGLDKYDFKVEQYWIKSFLENHTENISQLGIDSLEVLENELKRILNDNDRKEDKTAFIWRPAIEEHEQNPDYPIKAKGVLITAIRDVLFELESNDGMPRDYIDRYFQSDYVVLKRLGIQHINTTWPKHKNKISEVIHEDYFDSYYIHELYELFNRQFDDFEEELQDNVLDLIDSLENFSDEKYKKEQIAFNKLDWLKAIKNSENVRAQKLYKANIEITGEEPDHPEFPFYSRSGFVPDRSKYTVEELASLETQDLIQLLNEFEEDKRKFDYPTKRGLANTFGKYLISTIHADEKKKVDEFIRLDDFYLKEVIGYLEKRVDDGKQGLTKALLFCRQIIKNRLDLFNEEFSTTLDSLNRFIREITRKDELFTQKSDLNLIREIIEIQLEKITENRSGIEGTKDRLTKAINTLKGKILEALINYSLLRCRIADKKSDDHTEEWNDLEPLFNSLINEKYDYVTASIFSRYFPNLIYLNKDWVQNNLNNFLNRQDEELWLAAINGLAYGKYLHMVFNFIVNDEQLKLVFKAYDENKIEYEFYRKFIQFSAIHFLLNDKPDAIEPILDRYKDAEISELVSSIRYLRENIHDDYVPRVFDLWELLLSHISGRENEFIQTLSSLCKWSVFIESFDANKYQLVKKVIPFAFKPKHFDFFLDEWIRMAKIDPKKTVELFLIALESKVPYLQEKKMIAFIDHLLQSGLEDDATKIGEILFENNVYFVAEYLDKNK